ncbi:MAG: YggT family protein [Phenylobacterium sp.]
MVAIIQFVFFVLGGILSILVWAIIISAILSWLVAFDVINLRNRFVYNVARFLEAVTQPVLRPFQRIIPPLGGVDISPIIAILIIQGVRGYILPALENFLIRLAIGG